MGSLAGAGARSCGLKDWPCTATEASRHTHIAWEREVRQIEKRRGESNAEGMA